VGDSGKAAYSTDGVTWTAGGYFGDTGSGGNGVAYGGGRFVVVSTSGSIFYSTDAVNWTWVGTSWNVAVSMNGITYGGGKFVAVGDSGYSGYSTDDVSWTAVRTSTTGTTNNLTAVTYGEGSFVTANDDLWVLVSPGDANWSGTDLSVGSPSALYGIAYGGGKFVATGEGGGMFYTETITAKLVFNAGGSVSWVGGTRYATSPEDREMSGTAGETYEEKKGKIREQFRGELKEYRRIQLDEDSKFNRNIMFLSGGAFGISFAFIDRIIPFRGADYKFILLASWTAFAAAVVFSVIIHLASSFIHGAYYEDVKRNLSLLESNKPSDYRKHWYSYWVMDTLYILALAGFLAGISCLIVFVFMNSKTIAAQ
jgi:hypothetical protein